jgi:hypothetical protein
MTGKELLDALKATGTGDAKLATAREVVRAKPDTSAMEIVECLRRSGAGEGTLVKCEDLLGVKILAHGGEGARPLFPVRAPIGGCKVGGRQFAAGEIVPEDVLGHATPDEFQTLGQPTTAIESRQVAHPPPAHEPATKATKAEPTDAKHK